MAEIIYHYLPKVVNLHSFVKANSATNKKKNWKVLSTKVFPKMGFKPSQVDINNVINCKRMAAENFLSVLRNALESTERVDLFATVNQPLKKKSSKTKTLGSKKPKMATFTDLEDEDEHDDPRQKELKLVLKLKDDIEDLEEKMILLRKTLR